MATAIIGWTNATMSWLVIAIAAIAVVVVGAYIWRQIEDDDWIY